MIADKLINYAIPPLRPDDKSSTARQWMDELHVTELPVVSDGNYLGILSEATILDFNEEYNLVENYPLRGKNASINKNHHFYDVLKLAYEENVKTIAIVDNKEKYLGAVTKEDIIRAFSETSAVKSKGAIIVLLLKNIDYSLAEISRLIESNEGKILSSYVIPYPEDPSKMRLTLKINQENISHTIATLERFGYSVETNFDNSIDHKDDKNRIDLLMHYLDL